MPSSFLETLLILEVVFNLFIVFIVLGFLISSCIIWYQVHQTMTTVPSRENQSYQIQNQSMSNQQNKNPTWSKQALVFYLSKICYKISWNLCQKILFCWCTCCLILEEDDASKLTDWEEQQNKIKFLPWPEAVPLYVKKL